jgi:hypothetical protein
MLKKFLDTWNSSHDSEQRKYYPNYFLTIYLKNKTQREFRATEQVIKEQTVKALILEKRTQVVGRK